MSKTVTDADRARWSSVVAQHEAEALKRGMADALMKLDAIVGECLGLEPEDVAFIREDLDADPFLRGIRPRYPGTVTRKQGFRMGLDAADRYQ